jgi:hypothetical protein
MNLLCSLFLFLLLSSVALAQSPVYHIRYDHNALRIPGNKFAITLVSSDKKEYGWGKYYVEVDSGRFASGSIQLDKSSIYKKHDSITVSVYTRKWFLGGKGKFVTSRRISYNYEDSIAILTNGNASLSPGDHLQFGIRTVYDNGQFSETWYPVKKKTQSAFQLQFEGGHLSKSKGDWKIDNDPTHIKDDRVAVTVRLSKYPAIADSLQLLLDYKAKLQCTIRSLGKAHKIDVFADAFSDSTIHAQLLKIEVRDSMTDRVYHYLVNTEGGDLTLTSIGADGASGMDGLDGQMGANGSDGSVTTTPVTTTNPDGTTTTTYTTSVGQGGDGSDGRPGEDGRNGENGFDGGAILVHYTPAAASFLHLIHATSVAGKGGSGGRGGTGGNGGIGGSGNPPGRAGLKGRDGNNGWDGRPGKSGVVRWVEQTI